MHACNEERQWVGCLCVPPEQSVPNRTTTLLHVSLRASAPDTYARGLPP
jgi:hypothetical protein